MNENKNKLEDICAAIEEKLKKEFLSPKVKVEELLVFVRKSVRISNDIYEFTIYFKESIRNEGTYLLQVQNEGLDAQNLMKLYKCFDDILLVMNTLVNDAKESIKKLEVSASDMVLKRPNTFLIDLVDEFRRDDAKTVSLKKEALRKYFFFEEDKKEYSDVIQTRLDALTETLKNGKGFNTRHGLDAQGEIVSEFIYVYFSKDNKYLVLKLNVLANEVYILANTKKNALSKLKNSVLLEEYDLKKAYNLEFFVLEDAIEDFLKDAALSILVGDGLLGVTLETYVSEIADIDIGLFDRKASHETSYQFLLDAYGEHNDCEGIELNHIDDIRYKNPDKVSFETYTEYKNYSEGFFYEIKLNNMFIVFAYDFSQPKTKIVYKEHYFLEN